MAGKQGVAEGVAHPAAVRRLERLSWLLDNSIPVPGTGRRFGVDALIGLVPGFGDAAGTALSAYIVVEAARLGAPAPVLMRMLLNVALEALVGAVPVLGDLFDAAWKANQRNVNLLLATVDSPHAARRSSRAVVVGVVLLLVVLLAGIGVLAFLTMRFLWGLLT